MFAEVILRASAGTPVPLLPTEALIATGSDSRVIVVRSDGAFEPVRVRTGRSDGTRIEILDGLRGGEQVVTSGQFLIDSEASLSGALQRLGNRRRARPRPPTRRAPAMIARIIRGSIANRCSGAHRRSRACHRRTLVGSANATGRAAGPFGHPGHHPHRVERADAAHRRGSGDLSAGHDDAVGAGGAARCAAFRSSATPSSICCSTMTPTCTGLARACSSI